MPDWDLALTPGTLKGFSSKEIFLLAKSVWQYCCTFKHFARVICWLSIAHWQSLGIWLEWGGFTRYNTVYTPFGSSAAGFAVYMYVTNFPLSSSPTPARSWNLGPSLVCSSGFSFPDSQGPGYHTRVVEKGLCFGNLTQLPKTVSPYLAAQFAGAYLNYLQIPLWQCLLTFSL